MCAAAFLLVLVAFLAARTAGRRLVRTSEEALLNLRVRTFAHIHRLSIAEQSEEKRGVFVARVTADADSLQQFTEYGGIAWLISFVQAFGALALMLIYSWQLSIVVVLLMVPLVTIMGSMQARLSAAFDAARTRVGEMLSEVSESVMGAAVVRAYGLDDTIHARVTGAIGRRYDAEVKAHLRAATLWPMSSVFYALTLSVVVAVGALFGPEWGLTFGTVTAFLFLGDVFLGVFEDLPEIYAETQTAIAGWRKILAVLDLPVEIEEPTDGVRLPTHGALDVAVHDMTYAYRNGKPVLHDIDVTVPAGSHIAIVGETGSGKSTFAKLLTRLADPADGLIEVGGVDLREIDPSSRRVAIRMVPQDGFLFDWTVRENVKVGRDGATDREVDAAFEELGLGDWVRALQDGLDTRAGERGEQLSVGERQLIALVRAQIADPGLLILDEATSAVDPATEARITEALRRLSAGRTTVTIAHRLTHRRARRPRAGVRRRPDRGGGHPRRTHRRARRVRRAVPELAGQHPGRQRRCPAGRGATGPVGPVASRAMPESKGRQKKKSPRYRAPSQQAKAKHKSSPRWYGPLLIALMAAGVLVIVLNYVGLIPGTDNQADPIYLWVGTRPDRGRIRRHHLLVLSRPPGSRPRPNHTDVIFHRVVHTGG